jgi:aryl-alcohol dehydrogenase-like predicted oxidoreductase
MIYKKNLTPNKKQLNHKLRKIIIGTAQFYSNYGIIKKKNKNPRNLVLATKKLKLNLFETSTLYKNSIKKINKISNKSNFIIKISCKNNNKYLSVKNFNLKVRKLIKIVGVKKIYALMFHDNNFLNKKKFYNYQKLLISICNENKLKFGYSIYSMKEFNFLIKNYNFNLIQVPLNIFNKDFINKKFKEAVSKKNIEVHARSVFLQGVLTNEINYLPKKFEKYNNILSEWNDFCIAKKISKVNAAINFVLNQKFINKIILGFKNEFELINLINNFKWKKINYSNKFKNVPLKLKYPNLWNDTL